jgi:hypothetical protein
LFGDRLSAAVGALLGRSAYQMAPLDQSTGGLDDPRVEETRRLMGGQLALPTVTQTRWYLSDLERAELNADAGVLEDAARLMTSARKDGVLSGVLSTRTGGLVRLPKKFRGDADVIADLELGHDKVRSVFDEVFPPTELALLAADGELLGVGVGELVPVAGRDYPVFVRLAPEFLVYRWVENRWYYRSIAGLIPITPGDGRWILHAPGGRMTPWQHGLWRAIGRAYIRKEHAALHKDNWEAKLANPARVAVAPAGAAEAQLDSWFKQVMAWGVNTVFGMRPGYDVKLLESNGNGFESFNLTIADQNAEMIIAIAGQTVTVDGGAGFQNSDIHKTIRADLIKATADALAYTINTQGIPAVIALRYGIEAIESKAAVVEWDVTPPKDRNSEATSMVTAANAITLLTTALAPFNVTIDIGAITSRYGIPVQGNVNGDGSTGEVIDPTATERPRLTLVPNDAGDDESGAVA